MRKKLFIFLIIFTFLIEGAVSLFFLMKTRNTEQDTVLINDCIKTLEENFGHEESYSTKLTYSVIDLDGKLLYSNQDGISTSVNEAIKNNDTILDFYQDGKVAGKVLFRNEIQKQIRGWQSSIAVTVLVCTLVQALLLIAYSLYLRKTIIRPFEDLSHFAERVAGGDLDVPLDMDKGHTFGSFTEAFDLMRTELKKSRAAEKAAYDAKKDMVAQLSHDIKTPVASIKSASEFGYELAKEEKVEGFVAVGGGSCGSMLEETVRAGCDAFITADVKHDVFLRAAELGIKEGDRLAWGKCATTDGKSAIDLDFCPTTAR